MDVTSYILAKKYIDELLKNQGSGPMAQEYIDNKIAELVNSAPEMLDTIGELAKAFQDNEEVIDALNKVVSNKVDKEDGKVLSSNDFTDELLEKVNNIENLSAKDWDQNDENHPEYIKNKPFGETGEFVETEIFNGLLINSFSALYDLAPLKKNNTYKVIIGNQEFITQATFNSSNILCLGNINTLYNPIPETSEYPFCCADFGTGYIINVRQDLINAEGTTFIISQIEPKINPLPKKYIKDYLVGEKANIQDFEYENNIYNSKFGAEIFNDNSNVAIGTNSHAEGFNTVALGDNSHAEGMRTEAIGNMSHAEGFGAKALREASHSEGYFTEASGLNSHAEGLYTVANTNSLHVEGRYNISEENPKLFINTFYNSSTSDKYDGEKIIYIYSEEPVLNQTTGLYTCGNSTKSTIKDLKVKDYFSFEDATNSTIKEFLYAKEFIGTEENPETNNTLYVWNITYRQGTLSTDPGKYLHIVGNGDTDQRSNAHTLETNGTAWFAGNVYVGSTSGVNMDEGSKKLATEDFVKSSYEKLKTNAQLEFYCIEDVTVNINGSSKVYPANSNVKIGFTKNDVFEIVPTSNNSILTLNSFPGALNTFYPWLEGVKQFSNILFDMNAVDMYSKWSQGNQGSYQVQFAQYLNCIFWSDNPYVSDVNKRTNYTLYYTSQLPLCYSSIPDNTFKAFFLAFGVNADPNWGNKAYRDSFAKATWATQAFSYYGARTIGIFGHDDPDFNITLPKDCRGLMYSSTAIENAGTFDAINVTNFGAKSGNWREAFGNCTSLKRLYIKNLKVNLNISWSPIDYNSIYYIISKAANTNKITIFVSPYTYNLLSSADFELATSKNITIALLTENYVEDKRLGTIENKADKTYVDEKITNLVNSAPEMLDTIGELAKAFQDNEEVIDTINKAINEKVGKEDGKGLSSNDFTDELLEKVNNIENLSAKDWNQNDETAFDYIKNRPFYETGEFNDIAIIEDFSPDLLNPSTCFDGNLPSSFIVGETYKIILDGIEYLCEAKKTGQFEFLGNPAGYFDNFLDVFLGNAENVDWGEQEPFCLYNGTLTFDKSKVKDLKISIYKRIFVVKPLDRKYIDYIPGENVTFKKVNIDGVEYICGEGSEIFNDYVNNIAIGEYSHAEGFQTKTKGAYAHAEGFQTKAEGAYAHAEGGNSYAKGLSSHAEGLDTISSGYGSHAEGGNTESFGLISHAEGQWTIANGEYSHVQGKYNLEDDSAPRFTQETIASGEWPEYDGEKIVYLLKQEPIFNNKTGLFTIAIDEIEEISFKNLQKNNLFLFTYPETDIIKSFYVANDFISTREDEESGIVFYKNNYHNAIGSENEGGRGAKLAHIVGNGANEENRSNAHTLDWEGNAWFSGNVYVGSTSGTNRDEGSKKLATEEYINIRVPAWTAEDEGKVLKIVNGTPTWV